MKFSPFFPIDKEAGVVITPSDVTRYGEGKCVRSKISEKLNQTIPLVVFQKNLFLCGSTHIPVFFLGVVTDGIFFFLILACWHKKMGRRWTRRRNLLIVVWTGKKVPFQIFLGGV